MAQQQMINWKKELVSNSFPYSSISVSGLVVKYLNCAKSKRFIMNILFWLKSEGNN